MGKCALIVVCQKCETRFRLDPERVPARGARVRCSRCKTAFFVKHPDASQDVAIEDLVNETTLRGAAVPDPTRDLTQPSAPAPEAAAATPAADGTADAASADDEQWELDDDAADRLPARAAPSMAADASSAPDLGPSEFGTLDLDGAGADAVASESGSGPDDGAFDDPPEDFGVDPGESVAAAPPPSAVPAEPAAPVPVAAEPPAPVAAASPVAAAPAADLDELGSPGDWNFLEEPAAEAAEEAPAEVEPAAAHEAAASRTVRSAAPARRFAALRDNLVTIGAYGLAVAGLLGGGWLAAQPLARAEATPIAATQHHLERGEARDVHGRYVQNAVGGPVYVVSGTFVPDGGPASRLRVEWQDRDGRTIPGSAIAGPGLREAELRERPPSVVRELLAERSPRLARGGPFDAVFSRVPPGAHGFVLRREELPPPPPPFIGPPRPPPSGALAPGPPAGPSAGEPGASQEG